MYFVTLRKDGVSYSLRLHEYDEAQGGGRLNKESTLEELQLGNLKIKYDEVHGFVPVSFDADGYSRERIMDGATYDASGRAAAAAQPQPAAAPAQARAQSVSIRVIYEKARDKTLSDQVFTFQARPTLAELQERIERAHPDLLRIDYSMRHGAMVIDESTWGVMDLQSRRGKPATIVVSKGTMCCRAYFGSVHNTAHDRHHMRLLVCYDVATMPICATQVVSNRRPFNAYNKRMGLELLGVTDIAPDAGGSVFQGDELALDEELPPEIQQCTTWRTIKDVLQHLADDMACRSHISEPHVIGKEAAKRELISPILMAAATIVGGIKVYAEFVADGVRANGFVDWVFFFKRFSIVVVEAKHSAPFDEFTGQLAAEMVAVREDFAMTVLNKRKLEAASSVMEVPSYGILTNGYMYQFFKYYMDESNNKVLVQSRVKSLNIESAQSHEEALVAVTTIVKHVVHILRAQVSAISQSRDLKKARII